MAQQIYSSEQYQSHFDPTTYLNMYCNTTQPLNDFHQYFLKTQHNFWSNFQPSLSNTTGEIRYLEYGGGPVVYPLISAAPKVDRIVFAEYLEANRQAILSWRKGNAEAYNWKPFFEHVVVNLEGEKPGEALLKREQELKKKIKSVVPCDVYKSPIISLEDFDLGKPFDVISTNFCFECTVGSAEHYKRAVAELCQLLKPNGYLQMMGGLEETYYYVGKQKYCTVPLRMNTVMEALKEAQLKDIRIEIVEEEPSILYTQQFMFYAIGRRIKQH